MGVSIFLAPPLDEREKEGEQTCGSHIRDGSKGTFAGHGGGGTIVLCGAAISFTDWYYF